MYSKTCFSLIMSLILTIFLCGCLSDDVVKDETTTQESTEVTHSNRWAGREKEEALYHEYLHNDILSTNENLRKYLIKVADYDFSVFTPEDPDEYFYKNEDGNEVFDINSILDKYGWKEIDNPHDGYGYDFDSSIEEGRTYSYESGDMTILLQLGYVYISSEKNNYFYAFRYSFVKTGSLKEPYYNFMEPFRSPSNDAVCMINESQPPEYLIDEELQVSTSKDVCVLLTAVITWVDIKPEANPLHYFQVPWPNQSEDFRRYLGFDWYEI